MKKNCQCFCLIVNIIYHCLFKKIFCISNKQLQQPGLDFFTGKSIAVSKSLSKIAMTYSEDL